MRGQVAIDAIEELRLAGMQIRHHHKNYDGSGFPDGLAGEAIPLAPGVMGRPVSSQNPCIKVFFCLISLAFPTPIFADATK